MAQNSAWFHCIDLDVLSWQGRPKKEQDELRRSIHENLVNQEICHIFRLSVHCYCGKISKDARIFLEVDISAVANCKGYSDWAMIAGAKEKTEKIRAEGILENPDISFCLVAQYLRAPDKEDKNKKVEVNFAGTSWRVPLHAIKRVILRP